VCGGTRETGREPPSTTQEGLRKQAEQQQRRKKELELAFNLNWTAMEPEIIEKVVHQCWQLEETCGDLWNQCEKLREMECDGRMPVYSFEDRQRMLDNTDRLLARGDWQMDPGTTYHRRIKKKPSTKCTVPTEDVHAYYSKVWNPDPRPENTFVPAKEDSPRHMRPPDTEDTMRLSTSFAEHMVNEDAIRKCLNSKHDLSALGLDRIGYCHRKFGKALMTKLIAAISKDCAEHRQMPQMWKGSHTALLYKKDTEEELKNWRLITITCCIYQLFTTMMTQWIQNQHSDNKLRFESWTSRLHVLLGHFPI
jgi:hypothetical protein